MIESRAGYVANFNAIKDSIRQQASKGEHVKVEGDTYTVTDSFVVGAPDGNYTVRAKSSFDNDPKTKDTVSVALHDKDGVQENREYVHYSAKKLVFFNDERLTVNTQKHQQGNGAIFVTNSSQDFSI